jgi:predicted nucleic acid-binding protein
VRAFVDTNVIVRHLTQDPPDQGQRATAFLFGAEQLRLADVVVAETVYVLQSVYGASRADVAQGVRATVEFPAIELENRARLLRALDVYERDRIDFADAYLVALAEASAITQIASFDRSLDRVQSVTRVEP